MRSRRKKWALPYLEGHGDFALKSEELEALFDKAAKPFYLEIGAGKGAFMRQMAPRLGGTYLCLERDLSAAATLARGAIEEGIQSAYLVNGDFDFVKEHLPASSFKAIFLNFPDPWPKKRHEGRRLCTQARLKAMGELLEIGGELRLKTDSEVFYRNAAENIPPDLFRTKNRTEGYDGSEPEDAMSEYEERKRGEGLPIYRLVLERI